MVAGLCPGQQQASRDVDRVVPREMECRGVRAGLLRGSSRQRIGLVSYLVILDSCTKAFGIVFRGVNQKMECKGDRQTHSCWACLTAAELVEDPAGRGLGISDLTWLALAAVCLKGFKWTFDQGT